MKHIIFKVSKVDPEVLYLEPMQTTARFRKLKEREKVCR